MKKKMKWGAGALALAVVYVFGGPHAFSACGGINDYALERLRACPAAVDLLGTDIDITYGISYGSTESQGGLERASVRLPVAGSKARGAYRYSADRVGDDIRFSGTVSVDGTTIDVGSCSNASNSAEVALTGTGVLDGKVKRSDHPNVKVGSVCNGSLTLRGTKNLAQLMVKCDGVTIYDGEGVAKNDVNDPRDPDDDTLSYTDDKKSGVDETPAVSMVAHEGKADGDSGTIIVTDVAHGSQPAFEIEISL